MFPIVLGPELEELEFVVEALLKKMSSAPKLATGWRWSIGMPLWDDR